MMLICYSFEYCVQRVNGKMVLGRLMATEFILTEQGEGLGWKMHIHLEISNC